MEWGKVECGGVQVMIGDQFVLNVVELCEVEQSGVMWIIVDGSGVE